MLAGVVATLGACRSLPVDERPEPQDSSTALQSARQWARRAERLRPEQGVRPWLRCAADAYVALGLDDAETAATAAVLSTHCTDGFLSGVLARRSRGWSPGRTHVDGTELDVEFRDLSPYLRPPVQLDLARNASMAAYGGQRHALSGFGVALTVVAPRCRDTPLCELLPPEGVFRGATAWIEQDANGPPRLVIADPLSIEALHVGARSHRLAYDTSAPYARGTHSSKLHRLAIWGLLGGNEVGRRAGLYLLDDYDARKRPLVMIHGLGSSPLTWARLTDAVWGSPELRARYQVWHVVYQTNAPLLVTRRRVQSYLDEAWSVLDPDGDDPARSGMVLVGHSLGGVIARMLCVDSGDTLWDAAFLAPPEALQADPDDRAVLDGIFRFRPYPGIDRAIFIAAPHRGSPSASRWLGRLARVLIGRRTPEIRSLRRVARANPTLVRAELRESYLHGSINSVDTLQELQPVRRAGETLLPADTIRYHTIAGTRSPDENGDGVVPVESTLLPGAESTLLIRSGHNVHESPQAVAEVLRILYDELAERTVH